MEGASPRLPYLLFFILILYAGANTFPWSQARHEYAAPTYSHPTPPVPAWQALDSGSQACLLRLYVWLSLIRTVSSRPKSPKMRKYER